MSYCTNQQFMKSNNMAVAILTYQSKEAADILLGGSNYFVDSDKCREKRDYTEDCLNGLNPIYIVNPNYFSNRLRFSKEELLDGTLLFSMKCEMSTTVENISELVIIEAVVMMKDIFIAKCHNSCDFVNVTHCLSHDKIMGMYKVEYDNWYFPTISQYVHYDSALFSTSTLCDKSYSKSNPLLRRNNK